MEKLLASHLRIGNYYDSSDGLTFSITPHDINELFNDPSDDYYNPITLTEEWLLKFGFEMDKGGIFWINNKWGFHGYLTPDNIFCIIGYSEKHLNIKYVHQLQNIYFALTGEELTLKQ